MIREVRDEALVLMENAYAAVLAQVATEYGANAPPPPRSVSRSRRRHDSYPLAVVRPPSGRSPDEESTDSSIHTDHQMWVLVWRAGSDDEKREAELELDLEAMTRLFHGHRCGGAMRFTFAGYDFSPLGKEQNETVQAVGVLLNIRTATDV